MRGGDATISSSGELAVVAVETAYRPPFSVGYKVAGRPLVAVPPTFGGQGTASGAVLLNLARRAIRVTRNRLVCIFASVVGVDVLGTAAITRNTKRRLRPYQEAVRPNTEGT